MHVPNFDESRGVPPLLWPWVQRFRKANPAFEVVAFRGKETVIVGRQRRYYRVAVSDLPEQPRFVEV